MKVLIIVNIFVISVIFIDFTKSFSISRRKRAAYDLPDDWQLLMKNGLNTNFECKEDGYFADVDNGCQLFHVCQLMKMHFSKPRFIQHTFICGNGTIFNQLTQTCTFENQLSIPCESSQELFYMNERIGALNTWFHSSEDYQRIRTVNNNNEFNSILKNAQNSPSNSIDENSDDFDDDFDQQF